MHAMQITVSSFGKHVLACVLFSHACADALRSEGSQLGTAQGALLADHYRPGTQTTWQIQLQGKVDTTISAELFDIDLFDNEASEIAGLHAQGRKVICYFDTAYEAWRPDAAALEPYRMKPMDGWPGQYWLDISREPVREVMWNRINLAAAKGCDGVDADDVDIVSNDTGLSLLREEQQDFIIMLARLAHAKGMAFGLKNDLEDIARLQEHVDFAINEQCLEYDECEAMKPLTDAGKPVFHIEYTEGGLASAADRVCPQTKSLGFKTLLKSINLDAARYACP